MAVIEKQKEFEKRYEEKYVSISSNIEWNKALAINERKVVLVSKSASTTVKELWMILKRKKKINS